MTVVKPNFHSVRPSSKARYRIRRFVLSFRTDCHRSTHDSSSWLDVTTGYEEDRAVAVLRNELRIT